MEKILPSPELSSICNDRPSKSAMAHHPLIIFDYFWQILDIRTTCHTLAAVEETIFPNGKSW
jgi:hypothetical protein